MHPLPIDGRIVDECRDLAAQIAQGVMAFIREHTTVSIERTVLRAYGVEGADPDGVPLVNTCVERVRKSGQLGRGIAYFRGHHLVRGAADPQEAAETIAYGQEPEPGAPGPSLDEIGRVLAPHTRAAIERIDAARRHREADRARLGMGVDRQGSASLRPPAGEAGGAPDR